MPGEDPEELEEEELELELGEEDEDDEKGVGVGSGASMHTRKRTTEAMPRAAATQRGFRRGGSPPRIPNEPTSR